MTLRERLRSGEPVITSELVPPRGADAASVRAQVATLSFADALNVTDLPQARTRMSALAAAALVIQAGGRPILQMTTRDRNRLALAADAIGAAALGVEAILPLFGDPVPEGVDAQEVRDVDSPGLVALLADLAQGRTPDGLELDVPAALPDRLPPRRRARRRSRTCGQDRRGGVLRADADGARRRGVRRLARADPRRRPVRARRDPPRARDPALRRARRRASPASARWSPTASRRAPSRARGSPSPASSPSSCSPSRASPACT